MVDTFDTLMNAVVTDFKGLASGYAEQVRIDLASDSAPASQRRKRCTGTAICTPPLTGGLVGAGLFGRLKGPVRGVIFF